MTTSTSPISIALIAALVLTAAIVHAAHTGDPTYGSTLTAKAR